MEATELVCELQALRAKVNCTFQDLLIVTCYIEGITVTRLKMIWYLFDTSIVANDHVLNSDSIYSSKQNC